MKKTVLFALLLLSASSFALAGPKCMVLGNGTSVVLSENRATSLASVCIMIEGGTRCEGPGERGTYSLLPGLLLSGTASRTKAEISRELSLFGDSFDSYTAAGYWAFEATVPAVYLETLLLLLNDLLFFPGFSEGELEKLKRTKIQSIRAEKDSAMLLLSDLYHETFYPDLHAHREVRIANIDNTNLLPLQEVHRRYFRPPCTVISIAGAINMEEAMRITEGPEKPLEKPSAQEDGPLPSYRAASGGVTQAGILTGTRLSGFDRSQEHLLQLAGTLLGSSFGGRLFVELREKNGLVYSVSTGYSLETEPFTWYVVSTSRKRNTKAVREKTEDILRQFRRKPPSASELSLAKEQLKTRLRTEELYPGQEARYNAVQLLRGETPRGLDERLRMIDTVTQKELASFIQNHFPARYTTLVVR